jgi:uncharacterized protein YbbK (DUF523 family)
MEKILVSACLLGEPVRYDGNSKLLLNETLAFWLKEGRLVGLCPEVAGGLSIPRQPAEIQPLSGKIITCDGQDVSQQFNKGAFQALKICQRHHIKFALLKETSPSCGSRSIYDGTFTKQKMLGEGVTTKLLRVNGIQVFSENNIVKLSELINDTNSLP